MGQSNSTYVQLEKKSFGSHEQIRGTAYLNAAKAINADAMILRIVGEERTQWIGGTGKQRHSQSGRKQVLGVEMTLGGKGTIEPGAYSFPFQFVLPSTLPGSMSWFQDYNQGPSYVSDAKASIVYYVQAVCVTSSTFSRNVKSDLLFFDLHQACPSPVTGPVEVKDTQSSMVCCCFSQGHITGSMFLLSNVALAGSAVLIKGQLENKTSAPIVKVMVNLEQRVALTDGWGDTKEVTQTVSSAHFPCDPTELKPGAATKALEVLLPVPSVLKASQGHWFAAGKTFNLPATCHGKLIKVEYYLEFVGKMGSLTHSFKIRTPLVISCMPPMPPMPAPNPPIIGGGAPPAGGDAPSPYPNIAGGSGPGNDAGATPGKLEAAEAPKESPPAQGFSYPAIEAPPNWYPTIQQSTYLDLCAQPLIPKKGTIGDDNEDKFNDGWNWGI